MFSCTSYPPSPAAEATSATLSRSDSETCLTTAQTRATSHTHTRLTALCPGLPRWAGTRQVKPIWILLEQEIVSGSDISWAICKSAPRSRQTTTPAPHYSVFLQAGCPSCRPTNSVKALKAKVTFKNKSDDKIYLGFSSVGYFWWVFWPVCKSFKVKKKKIHFGGPGPQIWPPELK